MSHHIPSTPTSSRRPSKRPSDVNPPAGEKRTRYRDVHPNPSPASGLPHIQRLMHPPSFVARPPASYVHHGGNGGMMAPGQHYASVSSLQQPISSYYQPPTGFTPVIQHFHNYNIYNNTGYVNVYNGQPPVSHHQSTSIFQRAVNLAREQGFSEDAPDFVTHVQRAIQFLQPLASSAMPPPSHTFNGAAGASALSSHQSPSASSAPVRVLPGYALVPAHAGGLPAAPALPYPTYPPKVYATRSVGTQTTTPIFNGPQARSTPLGDTNVNYNTPATPSPTVKNAAQSLLGAGADPNASLPAQKPGEALVKAPVMSEASDRGFRLVRKRSEG